MVPGTTSLVGFSGEIKWPLGQITLLVKVGDDEHSTSAWMDFMVVRSTSPFNGIIGRPGLRKMKAVPSTTHGMIKFPQPPPMNKVKEERIKVAINPEHPEQTVMIGSDLTEKTRSKLCNLLQRSLDIFAWTPTDMTGVPRQIAEHKLNVRKGCPPIGRNLEVYVDDLVIKSRTEDEVVRDIEETFKTLRKINMKLNPKKCTFEVEEGMFLGYQEVKVENWQSLNSVQGSGERRTHDGNGGQVDANLLCKPGAKGPGSKLHRHGKVSTGINTCKQTQANMLYLSFIYVERPEEEGKDDSAREEEPLPGTWQPCFHGMFHCLTEARRVILTDPEGVEFTYALRFQFETTNNEAEYEALIAGLRIAEKMGVKNLEVNVDSKLVANQVNGTYIAKETDMVKYLEKVKALTNTFRAFSIKQVPRSKNKKADALSKMASTSFAHLSKQVLVEELKEKSVKEKEVLAVVEEEGDTWMTPIHEYLTDETLPAERKKARAIKRKSQRFAIINGILYKKSFLGPWLRCVGPSQANYVLREIHEGSCSMHAGTRSVVAKALRTGYYWPGTMAQDARAL
ncbi:reverse transcriptase domain-containing protein [Tanacetum coccineum]|uniref:Reverse transcriptase domain-containing protein n=1 Tax=Tanacetum coccineum TaxID=301880 RepID=A0ABQ5HZH6_9ASTR